MRSGHACMRHHEYSKASLTHYFDFDSIRGLHTFVVNCVCDFFSNNSNDKSRTRRRYGSDTIAITTVRIAY